MIDQFQCIQCQLSLTFLEKEVICAKCSKSYPISNGVIRCHSDDKHENWGLQWNRFYKIQLDSFNGSSESEDRLFLQSGINPDELVGKTVLEIGAGNGRFTEIFLKYGANVCAIDYSTAIDANYRNHSKYVENDRLILVQGDLFNLPIKSNSFDMVFCYGVIQHTGDNQKALNEISRFPQKNKRLYVDIYSNSIRHYNPILYFTRFLLGSKKNDYNKIMSLVERFVSHAFPVQFRILKFLHGKGGLYKYIKYAVNRSPNSVYGINLYLDGKIKKDLDLAYQWSLMDTLDGWASRHDHPVSMKKWKKILDNIKGSSMSVIQISGSGQGHTAVLQKNVG